MSSSSSGGFQILKLGNRKKKKVSQHRQVPFICFIFFFVFIYLQKPTDVSFICIKLSPGGRLGLFLLLLFYFPSQESWPGYWTCPYSKNLKYLVLLFSQDIHKLQFCFPRLSKSTYLKALNGKVKLKKNLAIISMLWRLILLFNLTNKQIFIELLVVTLSNKNILSLTSSFVAFIYLLVFIYQKGCITLFII